MSLYVASSIVLCTLMLLSVTEADEYPGKDDFSGIYLHKCDSVRYVSKGVMNCIREHVPEVQRPDNAIFNTLLIEAVVNETCSAKEKVTCCVSTLLKDCPNKGEIMEGYLGRYVVCDGDKSDDWITHWARSNSEAQFTRECSSAVRNASGHTIDNCFTPGGIQKLDWKSLNVTEGARIIRKYVSDAFDCTWTNLNIPVIESEPACDDLDRWSNILTMIFLYLNCNRQITYLMYLSEEDMARLQDVQNVMADWDGSLFSPLG